MVEVKQNSTELVDILRNSGKLAEKTVRAPENTLNICMLFAISKLTY